jgi:hypothetical protein
VAKKCFLTNRAIDLTLRVAPVGAVIGKALPLCWRSRSAFACFASILACSTARLLYGRKRHGQQLFHPHRDLTDLALGRLADMPEGDRLCHGDFHPVNVLGQNSRPMVIDWPDACYGDPAADVCRSYLLLKLHAEDIAEPYLDAYCNITNTPRASILDWLPYIAAARLAEDVLDDWPRLLEIVHG